MHGGTGIGGGGDRSSFSTGELSSWDAGSCWQRALVRAAGVGRRGGGPKGGAGAGNGKGREGGGWRGGGGMGGTGDGREARAARLGGARDLQRAQHELAQRIFEARDQRQELLERVELRPRASPAGGRAPRRGRESGRGAGEGGACAGWGGRAGGTAAVALLAAAFVDVRLLLLLCGALLAYHI